MVDRFRLLLNLLATFAEFEREIIGERLRDARAALRSRGIRNAGRVPFGYSADPLSHQLVVRPQQAVVLKRMFEMAAAGAPPSVIATWLNTQGESNRNALDGRQPWSPKAVLRILGNHVYLGRMGAVADAHDAIIDEELFTKARTAVDARRTRVPSQRPPNAGDLFLLRQLLRCVHWDRLMTTSSSRGLPAPSLGPKPPRGPLPPRFYRCRSKDTCSGSQVAAEDIEGACWLGSATPAAKSRPRRASFSLDGVSAEPVDHQRDVAADSRACASAAARGPAACREARSPSLLSLSSLRKGTLVASLLAYLPPRRRHAARWRFRSLACSLFVGGRGSRPSRSKRRCSRFQKR